MMDLAEYTENDIVEAFKTGLKAFLDHIDGSYFGSRQVTPQKEKRFQSDQDFSVLFRKEGEFSLHLFSLQFKRWDGSGWKLSTEQLRGLKSKAKVIAYCLPQPAKTTPANCLHFFFFVNPGLIPLNAGEIRLESLTDIRILPIQFDDIAGRCASELKEAAQKSRKYHLWYEKHGLFSKTRAETLSDQNESLLDIVQRSGDTIQDALSSHFLLGEKTKGEGWGTQMTVRSTGKTQSPHLPCIPHRSWGEFLQAVEIGARTVALQGSPSDSPDAKGTPGISDSPGFGLKFTGCGKWGEQWVTTQIKEHIDVWLKTYLESPAAVIAYESFSRSLEFIHT